MHLFNLVLAGVQALCVIAAPTDFELQSALAIPVPGSATYDADLAAAIDYARSHSSYSVQTSGDRPEDRLCGYYTTRPQLQGPDKDLRTTGTNMCINTDPGEKMDHVKVVFCPFCMFFDEDGCQGNLVWNGGPQGWKWAAGSKSYICFGA